MNTHKMFLVEELPRGHGWVWYCTNLSIPLAFSLYQLLPYFFQVVLVVMNLPTNAGNTKDSLVPGWGKIPEGGHGNPLQYSCLENPMDRGAWWSTVHRVAQSQTHWSNLAHTIHLTSWSFKSFPSVRQRSLSLPQGTGGFRC